MKMNSHRKNIFWVIVSHISNHPWLKIISLLLAVVVWIYVKGERI